MLTSLVGVFTVCVVFGLFAVFVSDGCLFR